HLNPEQALKAFDFKKIPADGGPTQLNFSRENTERALARLKKHRRENKPGVLQDVALTDAQVADLLGVLKTLTDPCLKSRECLAKWIPGPDDPDPDGLRICAKDKAGKELWAPSCEPSRYRGAGSPRQP